ncbi:MULTISPECIES: bacteriocin immunity protein [Lactobacillus]|uniref:Bacteriocin immunity protein n=1 Tax=Lactobacillus xujianguonis TaxID=2495899 RepID=A0A437SUL9_9LACO|nr:MULTISPECIES: bacteriocin immunity protein [Lactobacillus]RVU70594.1 bacteriocin immunity protein [Lactobacillus xujianguonis]RVU73781.1 bacteriocin immunity protein [Lactobacillus xujianguonis]
MFNKKQNQELSPDIMAFKNALEEVRFTPEVEHDAELIEIFDEAIDKAEKGEAVQTIYGRLSYQITEYIQTHHFKAPKPVSDFIHGSKRSILSGLTSVPVSWNTVH